MRTLYVTCLEPPPHEREKVFFIVSSESSESSLASADLIESALRLCAQLQKLGASRGDELVIQTDNIAHFSSLFGRVYLPPRF